MLKQPEGTNRIIKLYQSEGASFINEGCFTINQTILYYKNQVCCTVIAPWITVNLKLKNRPATLPIRWTKPVIIKVRLAYALFAGLANLISSSLTYEKCILELPKWFSALSTFSSLIRNIFDATNGLASEDSTTHHPPLSTSSYINSLYLFIIQGIKNDVKQLSRWFLNN